MNIRDTSHHEAGFTLVEIAIVMLIVTLLLTGLVPTISSQIEQRQRNETLKQLDEIKQALIGYAVVNGRLPCPADGTTPSGQANAALVQAGSEYKNPVAGTPFVCFNPSGVLPWATLGVSETDAWGRRFSYRVTPAFSRSTGGAGCATNPQSGAFELCDPGTLTVLTAAVGGTTVSSALPAVIISHGVDGVGAYTTGGQIIPGAVGDQYENANNANLALNDDNFVTHDVTPTFDDLVVWISPNILFNRMVVAGKLP